MPPRVASHPLSGFTLLELLVVVIVLALVSVGILMSRNIVELARMQSVVSEYQKFNAAFTTFQLRFRSLPGDSPHATAYFGAVTQNGNGDGKIDLSGESLLVWQHLHHGGLDSTAYTGALVTDKVLTGVNVPGSLVEEGSYRSFHQETPLSGLSGNVIQFGRDNGQLSLREGALTPADALQIDRKLDDGALKQGLMVAVKDAAGEPCAALVSSWLGLFSETEDRCLLYLQVE